MALGWSVGGQRVEFRAAFPAGKIVVLDGTNTVHEQKLSQRGQWPLQIVGAPFNLKRTRGFMGPKLELFDGQGGEIAPSKKLIVPAPAPEGSICAQHSTPARFACARCGTFVCVSCAAADLTHCRPCAERHLQDHAKNAAALAYLAPVVVFGILGGVVLALLGAGAGAIAVAIARRTQSKALKILAAVGLYGAAVLIWLAFVVWVKAPK